MSVRAACLKAFYASLLIAVCREAQAQVYTLGSGGAQTATAPKGQAPQQPSLGFGTNIQNARLANSAEQALARGDHAAAADLASRAVKASPSDPHLWFLLGYAERLEGKTGLSAEAYQRGLRLQPNAIEGLSGLAQTYSLMGRIDKAEQLLKEVIADDPRRKDEPLLLGDLLMRTGDYATALDGLGRAERLQASARAELLMALCYQHLGKLDEANRYLELARRRAPNDPDVQRSLAGYYRAVGKYPEAIAALRSIRNPKPDMLAELAFTYQLAGDSRNAAALYAQAADAMPKNLDLQLSAAQAEVSLNAIDRAEPFLERAARLNPDYYRLHAIRGEIAGIEDRGGEAIREYTAAVEHLPEAPAEGPLYGIELHMTLMELYRGAKNEAATHRQLATAQEQIAKLDERGSDRPAYLRLRAQIEMSADELDRALADVNESLRLNSRDIGTLQLDGDVLMRLGRTGEAIAAYTRILNADSTNRFALTSLGYASRAAGRDQDAERYFTELARAYPSLYVPYLALGDLYTARREFAKAQSNYTKAFALAPRNPLVVAGGMNAAIEAHHLDTAEAWLARATPAAGDEPAFLREKERYLSFRGDWAQSAAIGRQAIALLPRDRDVVVYLGYDLLNLNQDDELLELTGKYQSIFPKEPDVPLLAGYVHKRRGQMDAAAQDFAETLARDPEVVTAYVNLGYVLNDLHRPADAAANFDAALKREPANGEAHLGLAYSDLDLHRAKAAIHEAGLAQRWLGDSADIHLIRATAYGREGMLTKAAGEYRAAIRFAPKDGALRLGLAGTLFAQRRFRQAIDELDAAEKFSPGNPFVYALAARAYANLGDREQTLRYVALAEQHMGEAAGPSSSDRNTDQDRNFAKNRPHLDLLPAASQKSAILLSTGEALNTIGDQAAAIKRFQEALLEPGSDRVGVRLDVAGLMVARERADAATRQVALAVMEAEAGDTAPPTGIQYIQAANVFSGVHEYQLSQNYLRRAEAAGAPETEVRVGMANNYLATGDTARAQAELAQVNPASDEDPDYQFLLAQASVFEQQHRGPQALTSFAQASNAAGEDITAERSLLAAGANEGLRVTPELSLLSNFTMDPIFEDTTVYVLDSKLDASLPVALSDTSHLPPPRSSLQTEWTGAYHLHLESTPTISGFFQVRNARGQISAPQTINGTIVNTIVNRNTTDYTFNAGVDPTFHIGTNSITLNSGVQGTVRRDSASPQALNQNLFRVFTYFSTSSFFDAVAASGYALRESGPFTEEKLSSRNWTAAFDFRVGAPWAKTALVTGWGASDQLFNPNRFENHYTSSYIGLEHRFSDRLRARAIVEDLRAWRTVANRSGIAQDLRPEGTINFAPTRRWNIEASSAWSSTRGFHVYDATGNNIAVTYARPFHRRFNDETGAVALAYPISFSAGIQTETFLNFPGSHSQQIRPYVSITLF